MTRLDLDAQPRRRKADHDPQAPVLKDDVRDMRDEILKEMRAGFAGIHQRQDVTNGRIGKAETVLATHGEKLRNLAREVFRRKDRRPDPEQAEKEHDVEEEEKALTRGELKLVIATILACLGFATFVTKVLPVLLKLLVTP